MLSCKYSWLFWFLEFEDVSADEMRWEHCVAHSTNGLHEYVSAAIWVTALLEGFVDHNFIIVNLIIPPLSIIMKALIP